MVVGLLGALMTAAYMTRCVYLTFHGEPRGHAADPHHPPHESGPRIVVPLYILTGLAIVAGLVNIPNTGALDCFPDGSALRFEHYFEPKGELLPERARRPSPTPSSTSASPLVSFVHRRRSASGSPTPGTSAASGPTASPSATGWPAPATASW